MKPAPGGSTSSDWAHYPMALVRVRLHNYISSVAVQLQCNATVGIAELFSMIMLKKQSNEHYFLAQI